MADARVAEVTRLIDGLRRDRRQHPHRGRGEYSGRAREVAGAIADMIESGGAADAVPLARRAVERVTAAMLHMDDSSGIIGDDLRMLTALYARACRAAPPDAKQLAAWLVTSRLDGPGWPDIELADFADALGQAGLDEVARLVTERRTAADPDSWAAIGIKFLRQQLAALSGDVDAHVAVLAENLHGARQYGEIVTVLRDAGRGADAERWARRGLAEDPASYWADGLREQLAGLLLASGRGEEAVCVRRAEFERRTLHQDYSRLRDTAERAGQWSGLREWALEYLRDRAQVKEFYVRELISVLIGEDLLDEAWTTAVAAPGQVPEQQWLELIGLREPGHPADVIGPLRDLIEMGIERTSDKYRYPKAIKALRRLRDDYQRAGDEAGFTTYLDELRQRQRLWWQRWRTRIGVGRDRDRRVRAGVLRQPVRVDGATVRALRHRSDKAHAAWGRRAHRPEPDPVTAPVVRWMFGQRLTGHSTARITRALNDAGVPCPSAADPARNPHRTGAGWTLRTVAAILANPRYTGRQVWNRQRTDSDLVDPANTALGHKQVQRWNLPEGWVISKHPAHPAEG